MDCKVIGLNNERECNLITLKVEGKERHLHHHDVSVLLDRRNESDICELVYLNKHCRMIFGTSYYISDTLFLNIVFEDVIEWEYKIFAKYDKENNRVLFTRLHKNSIRDLKEVTYEYIMNKEIYPNIKKIYTEINEKLLS